MYKSTLLVVGEETEFNFEALQYFFPEPKKLFFHFFNFISRYPSAPCSYVDHKYHSQCLQKHNFVRLLAYTYERGLHIDSFKLPVACSCHISEPRHYG